jgi:hypothetical protein
MVPYGGDLQVHDDHVVAFLDVHVHKRQIRHYLSVSSDTVRKGGVGLPNEDDRLFWNCTCFQHERSSLT